MSRLRRLPGSIDCCVRVLKENPNQLSGIHSIMIVGCYLEVWNYTLK
jgi:hypothetical protein